MPLFEPSPGGNFFLLKFLEQIEIVTEEFAMNSIIYLVGLVVVVAAVLSFFGLR